VGTFGPMLRGMREQQGLSLSDLAKQVYLSKPYLSRIETGDRPPTEDMARRCDDVLNARGELFAAALLDLAAARDTKPWQTADLIRKVQAGDVGGGSIEAIQATVEDLCCQYVYANPSVLRTEAHGWLKHIGGMLRKPIGLNAHRDLLVASGWLALLVGCLEYDMGMRAGAESTRAAALQLGREAGASEIVGWAHEMSAWFALTQGRYDQVIATAQAGQLADPSHSVHVQLIGQEAKAYARMGQVAELRATLDRGRRVLDAMPVASRTDNHFVVDPDKWDFYAMDAYRLAGDDDRASEHAQAVIALHTAADGTVNSPMRVAEAQLTLGVVAARRGDLEEAMGRGSAALGADRRSLPSLLMVAGELDSELGKLAPTAPATLEFRDHLRELR